MTKLLKQYYSHDIKLKPQTFYDNNLKACVGCSCKTVSQYDIKLPSRTSIYPYCTFA